MNDFKKSKFMQGIVSYQLWTYKWMQQLIFKFYLNKKSMQCKIKAILYSLI